MSPTALLLKSTLDLSFILLIALAAAVMLRRRSAAVRHWILACAVACGICAPLLGVLLPSWRLPVDRVSNPFEAYVGESSTADNDSRVLPSESASAAMAAPALPPMTTRLVEIAWAAGAAVNVAFLLAGMWRLRRIRLRSSPVSDSRWTRAAAGICRAQRVNRDVLLLQSDHPSLLVTWGVVRPTIVLPTGAQEWTEDRVRVALSHECSHIQRADWLVQIAAELLRSIHWFNPLAWVVCRRLRIESEHAADDAVLGGGIDAPEYATHLLDIARAVSRRSHAWWPAPAIVRSSTLERRITTMLNTEVNRSPLTRRARAATVAALFAVAAAVASAQGALGTFSGSVLDPMNRTLVDARLILTNLQTQAKHEMRSDDTGRFEFTGLPRGDYALEVQFPGFSLLRGQITMGGQNVQQTLNLTVGTLQETITVVAGPSGTPTPERKSASVARAQAPKLSDCTPTAHGGSLKPPRKLLDVRPEYPVHLANAGTMGTVLMEAVIGKDGSVTNVRVVGPAHPDFDAAAVAAVRQWEFSTTLLNCMPIDVVMKVTVNFRTA